MDLQRIDFSPVEGVLRDSIADQAFPGCTAAVGSHEPHTWLSGVGALGWNLPARVHAATLYDLASLTKVVATTMVTMLLHQERKVALSDPVTKFIPEFEGAGKEKVELRHLLSHTSGMPSWLPLYKELRGYRAIVEAIIRGPLRRPPGVRPVYSDLGAILWGECLQRISGRPLATLAWERIFFPLAMRDTMFRPPATDLWRIAPTELDGSFRHRLIHGEVHDENAAAMGGVSAHAGLFSTAADLARLGRELVRALRGEGALLERDVVRLFIRRADIVPPSDRAFGWDTRSARGSSSGRFFSPGSFGHTGFSGTSIWVDPTREVYAILLTNRVHPTRENSRIHGARVRFHDSVMRCIDPGVERRG
jgi:CubicO group peptidase (beta-lactamase class C family)